MSRLFSSLNREAFYKKGKPLSLVYDFQEMCKQFLDEEKLTQEEFDYIIETSGGRITKI